MNGCKDNNDSNEKRIHFYLITSDKFLKYQDATPVNINYRITHNDQFNPSSITLKIYQGSTLIKTQPLSLTGGEQTTTWDGKDNLGSFAQPGEYEAIIEVSENGIMVESNRYGVKVIPTLQPVELSFTNDQPISGIEDPVWIWLHDYEPVCYIKGSTMMMDAKFIVNPPLSQETTMSIKADGGTFTGQIDNVPVSGSLITVNNIPITQKLEDKVYSFTKGFEWFFKPEGSSIWFSTETINGAKDIYVVYGTQTCGTENFTESHASDAVNFALNQNTESDIAHTVMTNVSGDISNGCICGTDFENIWKGVKGIHKDGMCCCRAKGMSEVMQVLGVPGYTTIVYVNERPEPGSKGPGFAAHCLICDKDVVRAAWWGGFWNNWEGSLRSHGDGSICYAPAGKFEGTYNQIREQFGPYYWVWGDEKNDICTHLPPP